MKAQALPTMEEPAIDKQKELSAPVSSNYNLLQPGNG